MVPILHCLAPATSSLAHVPLHSAEVMFGMNDSAGEMRQFRQHAFIHADLPFALFSLSTLGARGCFFISMMLLGYSVVQCSCLLL